MEKNKYRHEFKYIISSAQLAVLKARISGLIPVDPYAGTSGRYNISSLYFDDYYNRCFYENENGIDPREKFRIRIYNHSSDRITLELKRKEREKTLKQSSTLSLEQFQAFIGKAEVSPSENLDPLQNKFLLEKKVHRLQPSVVVEYDRYPYVYRNGNVRITFDTNVSSSSEVDIFLEKSYPKRPVMPVGMHLMEVKFDEYLPEFIFKALQINSLQYTAYSKYYLCRRYTMKLKGK